MKRTKDENLLAGSTSEAPAGPTSSESMKHGEESPAMLLALLNSPLQSMIANKQARFLGHGHFKDGRVGTIVIFYDVQPTANNTLARP